MKQLADKPFALIGVNSDKNLVEVREAVKKKNINWRSFWGGKHGTSGPIAVKWSVTFWPTLYVIDAKGVIRYKGIRGEELDEAITKLLAEAGHDVVILHGEKHDEKEDKKEKSSDEKEGAN